LPNVPAQDSRSTGGRSRTSNRRLNRAPPYRSATPVEKVAIAGTAISVRAAGFEPAGSCSPSRGGTRVSHALRHPEGDSSRCRISAYPDFMETLKHVFPVDWSVHDILGSHAKAPERYGAFSTRSCNKDGKDDSAESASVGTEGTTRDCAVTVGRDCVGSPRVP